MAIFGGGLSPKDSEYRRLAGAKPILSLSCIYLVSPGALRAPTPPHPPFLGEGSTKKKNRLRRRWRLDMFASARAWWNDVCCKFVAMCGSVKQCELSLKGTQSLAFRPKTAWFLFFLLPFASSLFSLFACINFQFFFAMRLIEAQFAGLARCPWLVKV